MASDDFSYLTQEKPVARQRVSEPLPAIKGTQVLQTRPILEMPSTGTAKMWQEIADTANNVSDDIDKEIVAADARYMAKLQNDIDAKYVDLREKYNHDPEGFAKASDFYRAQTVGNVPGRIQDDTLGYLSKRETITRSNILSEKRGRDRSLATQELGTRLDGLSNEMAALAYQGKVETPEYIQNAEELSGVYKSMVGLGLMTDTTAAIKLDAVHDRLRGESLIGMVDNTYKAKGINAAKSILSSLEDPELNLSVSERHSIMSRAESILNKNLATDRAPIRNEIEQVNTAAKLGLLVPDEKLSGLIARASAVGLNDESEQLSQFSMIQKDANTFALRPMDKQKAEMDSLKDMIEKEGDLSAAPKYGALKNVYDNKVKIIKDDPWSFYGSHGIVTPASPINLADPDSLSQELSNRRAGKEAVRMMDGIDLPLLTKPELEQLKSLHAEGEPKTTAAVLTNLASTMKRDEIKQVASRIAPSSPTLAIAMSAGNSVVTERILSGERLEAEVSKDDVRRQVNSELGSAIADATQIEPIQDALFAYYKQLSFMAGDTGQNVNPDRVKQAVRDVIGPVVEVGGGIFGAGSSKIISYRDDDTGDFVSEDDLSDILDGITDEQISTINGTMPQSPEGTKFSAEKIKKYGRFVTAGNGHYAIIIDGLGYVANPDGSPFIIDARRYKRAK